MAQQKKYNLGVIFTILILAISVFWLGYLVFKRPLSVDYKSFEEMRSAYNDSVSYYKDRLGVEVATKQVAIIRFNDLQRLDSSKYTELKNRYEWRLKQIVGSSAIRIEHDAITTEITTSNDFDQSVLGLIEYSDSCIYMGMDFTDTGTYLNYLIAATEVSSTILQKDGKIMNDVTMISPCGKIAQVKTFVFAPEPKKWYQKPLVVGGIGLGAGLITGIILAK